MPSFKELQSLPHPSREIYLQRSVWQNGMMWGLPCAAGTHQGRSTPVPAVAHALCDQCQVSDTQQSYEGTMYKEMLPFLSRLEAENKSVLIGSLYWLLS